MMGRARWSIGLGGVVALLALLLSSPGGQAQPPPTRTPFVMPTLPPSPTPQCPGIIRNRLIIWERGRVAYDDPDDPLNIRSGPNTTYEILGEIPVGGIFFVLDGPQCSDLYTWFYVEYGDVQGWVAEGTINDRYFVEPYPPG